MDVGLITQLPKSGDLPYQRTGGRYASFLCHPGRSASSTTSRLHGKRAYLLRISTCISKIKIMCESALIELDTIIQKARNEEKVVALVMTDMSAAFNLIKKEILVSQFQNVLDPGSEHITFILSHASHAD